MITGLPYCFYYALGGGATIHMRRTHIEKVCLSCMFKSIIAERIVMKCEMKLCHSRPPETYASQFNDIAKNNIEDARSSEVGTILALSALVTVTMVIT
jgi:hypothetical protein